MDPSPALRYQLQSSFIVIVNPYASVFVLEAPDVDFKNLIFHNSMANFFDTWLYVQLKKKKKVQWVF